MRPRALAVAWVLVAVVFIALLLVELGKYRSLAGQIASVTAERQRLTSEIQLKEQQLLLELRKHAPLLQEMQWSLGGADPSAFLNRIAELAREKRMTITTIGPLEQRSSPQFTKSWHAIQVRAPYREIRELATRIEQDRGILEDVRIQAAPAATGPPAPGTDEVQANFNLVALEISPQGKTIMQQALAATGGAAQALPGAAVALPVPTGVQAKPPGRDPFAFLTPPAPRAPAGTPGTPAAAAPPAAPLPEVALKGIVSFPDGFLAIVNNQIVKVGDTVSGYRVERITENSVILTRPDAATGTTSRTIELPELAPAPAAAPRR
jgi:hypothetical protein